MNMRKFFKLTVWFCISAFCILSIAAYYINFIYPDSRPPNPSIMKGFLIETKDEAWLQKRIEEGKLNYSKLVQQKRDSWDAEMQAFKKTIESCKSGSDAYRIKNSYECNNAWHKLGGNGEFKPYLTMSVFYQERKFIYLKGLGESQEEMIDDAILRGCRSAKTIRQARKIGCYY